ncbi:MAG: N-acetyl-gamma-glutamyl-phosphate reductase [Salinispira sp.]
MKNRQRIFIDGQSGTVGLSIRERLGTNANIELIDISNTLRKDSREKLRKFRQADLAVLCLPDDGAAESAALIEGLGDEAPLLLDASSAHRTSPEWVYGFPEMSAEQTARIRTGRRVANPGCYPTGAIALLRPLVDERIVPPDYPISIQAVSGYSGGGKNLISLMEEGKAPSFTLYGLDFQHKHLPEIQLYSGLQRKLIMIPSVSKYRQGMIVSIPLHLDTLPGHPSADRIRSIYRERYQQCERIAVIDNAPESELEPEALNNTDNMEIYVYNKENHALLMSRLDNLGMGAAGTAIRNVELMLGM